jgi:Zn-finger nucleic acid-binding protein
MSGMAMRCPRCRSALSAVDHEGVVIEVCPHCKGEWLQAGELVKIVEHHAETFSPEEIGSLDAVNRSIFTTRQCDDQPLDCPSCETVELDHFNYADTSGVMLHKCPECGGIWTDKDQLEAVEILVDGWKGFLEQDSVKYGPILAKLEAGEKQERGQEVSISRFGFVNAVLRAFLD